MSNPTPSPPPLPAEVLQRLSDAVGAKTGLHFPRERWGDLERGVRSAAREFGFDGPGGAEACAQWLSSSSPPPTRRQVETLASHLTIGETYFFREKGAFRALEEQALPELIAARRGRDLRLRLWSAGCCTGEEPYSLAIALLKLLPDIGDWDVTLLATDINPRFLQKAAEGVYGDWSFRDAPPGVKERFFTRNRQGRYAVLPRVKDLVTFAYLNLAEDSYPSLLTNTNAMDLVLCRNVLIYLGPAQAQRLAARLALSLGEGGWLFVGAAETSQALFSRLVTVNFPHAIAYRKQATARPAVYPDPIPALDVAPVPPLAPVPPPVPVAPVVPPAPSGEAAPRRATVAEAAVLYEQGRYAEVIERLLPPGPGEAGRGADPEASALLAKAFANQGDLGRALAWCERAGAAAKLDPRWHYLRGTILQEKGDNAAAAVAFRGAIYLDPDFVMAHFAMARAARRLGKPEEAEKHLENARGLLAMYAPEAVVPESEGAPARQILAVIASMRPGRPASRTVP